MQNLKPLRDLVHVQEAPAEDEKTAGGIILHSSIRKPVGPVRGTVVALGKDCTSLAEGDVVLFDKFSSNELGDGAYLIKESLIHCVVTE